MTAQAFDHAVFGASPLAMLLAGLLALRHGRKVCLVTAPPSPFRLARGYDLSVAPVTRPETWQVLKALTPEMLKILNRIGGRGLYRRLDPVFYAEHPASRDALSTMRHAATGFGYAVERLPRDSVLDGNGDAYAVRDAVTIERSAFEQSIELWLDRCGVRRIEPRSAQVVLRRDGTAHIVVGTETLDAAQTILADDDAILEHLDEDAFDAAFQRLGQTTVLTEPTRALFAPLMLLIDRGLMLSQRKAQSGITAMATGRSAAGLAEIGAALAGHGSLRRAGQVQTSIVASRDGGPVLGHLRTSKAMVIGGLGPTGAFFAPALARWIAGVATGAELSWCGQHAASPTGGRHGVAEFVPPTAAEVAA